MIDNPVSAAGNPPATFSPVVRAVIDSVSEGVVIFDQQGRLLYANAPARRVIDGQNGGGDVRNRLQTRGASVSVARRSGDVSSPTGWKASAPLRRLLASPGDALPRHRAAAVRHRGIRPLV